MHTVSGHHHHHGGTQDGTGRLALALGLLLGLMAAEVAAGVIADSLALLSDAAHMLTDAAALALALLAVRLARRPARGGGAHWLQRPGSPSARPKRAALVLLGPLLFF